jgi:hypothetical protein
MGFFDLFNKKNVDSQTKVNQVNESFKALKTYSTDLIDSINIDALFADPYSFYVKEGLNALYSYVHTYSHMNTMQDLNLFIQTKKFTDRIIFNHNKLWNDRGRDPNEYGMVPDDEELNSTNLFSIKNLNSGDYSNSSGIAVKNLDKILEYIDSHELEDYFVNKNIILSLLKINEDELLKLARTVLGFTSNKVFTFAGYYELEGSEITGWGNEIEFNSWNLGAINAGDLDDEAQRIIFGIYTESYVLYHKTILNKLLEGFDKEVCPQASLMSLKKEFYKISEKTEKYNIDLNLITRHIDQSYLELQETVDKFGDYLILFRAEVRTGGFGNKLNKSSFNAMSQLYEIIVMKMFEIQYVIFVANSMIQFISENDDFSFNELKFQIEPYGVFDKTIEKNIFNKLKSIDDKLGDISFKLNIINANLVSINKNIQKGFSSTVSQLDSIKSSLFFNNILMIINTFQLNRLKN